MWIKIVNHLYLFVFFVSVISILVTNIFNSDTVVRAGNIYPGVSIYEGLSWSVNWLLVIAPYLIGVFVYQKQEHIERILKLLVLFGFAYGFLIWFEARMSPQLHLRLYGFFQHDFLQHVRDGGFRPIVFMSHGLHVAFFAMLSFCALVILLRARLIQTSMITTGQLGFMGISILLCKSLGSIIFGCTAAPLLWLGSKKLIRTIAFCLVLIAVTLPITRSAGLFPTQQLLEFANWIDPARAFSLNTRFVSEDALLAHAQERPLLGWGSGGRNSAAFEGGSTAILDGMWIILIGTRGWVGFLSTFGLIFIPVYLVWRLGARQDVPFTVVGASLLLAISLIELIPNTTFGPWTWLLAGSITGYAASARQRSQPTEVQELSEPKEQSRRTVI